MMLNCALEQRQISLAAEKIVSHEPDNSATFSYADVVIIDVVNMLKLQTSASFGQHRTT